MRQFILPDDFCGSGEQVLTGENFHYLCRVLRKREGSEFPGLDKEGNPYSIRIEEIGEDFCRLFLEREEKPETDGPVITLVQCLPKGKKMEQVIRQAVEAGVARIIPVMSDHAVPQFDSGKDREKKRERWEKIAIEAMQQSGLKTLPVIGNPVKMDDLPAFWKKRGPGLICHQERIDDGSIHRYLSDAGKEICIVIGPEGGISPREIDLLTAGGFKPVYLGNTVLRTETAALFATAAVKTILLEKRHWMLI